MDEATVLAALPLIKMAAARLIPRASPADHTEDDLRQVLTIDLLKRVGNFDPTRASLARFIWVLADHRVAEIHKYERAQRRDIRRNAWSMNEPLVNGKEVCEHGVSLSADQYEMGFGRRSRPETELAELRRDVRQVVDSLPTHLAVIAQTLMFDSVGGTVAATGLSRAAVYRRVAELREIFTSAGLHHYIAPGTFSGSAESGFSGQEAGHE